MLKHEEIEIGYCRALKPRRSWRLGPVLCPALPSLSPMSRLLPIALSHHTDGPQVLLQVTVNRRTLFRRNPLRPGDCLAEKLWNGSNWTLESTGPPLSLLSSLWKHLQKRIQRDDFLCSAPEVSSRLSLRSQHRHPQGTNGETPKDVYSLVPTLSQTHSQVEGREAKSTQ